MRSTKPKGRGKCGVCLKKRAFLWGFWAFFVIGEAGQVFGQGFSLSGEADSSRLVYRNLSRADGLPADAIYEVVQDRQGYTWIATDNGLARFDGHNIRVFRNTPGDPGTIADNSITALSLSNDSNFLWLGTFQGLSLIDLQTGAIRTYAHDLRGTHRFPVKKAKCFLPGKNGGMWIGSDFGLIYWPALHRPFRFYIN